MDFFHLLSLLMYSVAFNFLKDKRFCCKFQGPILKSTKSLMNKKFLEGFVFHILYIFSNYNQ